MINLAISGCLGRMGQSITQLALADKDFKITALLEREGYPPSASAPVPGVSISTSLDVLKGSEVLIEFTTPEATMKHLAYCLQNGVKMVIGTTGLDAPQVEAIKNASQKIPIVFSSNMSVGVNVCFKLLEMLSAKTPSSYEARIIEAHHIHKKDAPSGTAKTMAEIIAKASSKRVKDIQSIREGEIVGDHKVIFESAEDVIVVEHHAKTRDMLSKGALVAVKFLQDKKKGLFNMQDVLGLK